MILGTGLSIPTGKLIKEMLLLLHRMRVLDLCNTEWNRTLDPSYFLNNVNNLEKFKIGEQILFKTKLSKHNSKGYHYGNLIDLKSWISYRCLKIYQHL